MLAPRESGQRPRRIPERRPPAFSHVIGSRRNSVASTIVSTGTTVAMIDVSMGEVSDSPHRNSIWLSWMPKTEARSSSAMSRRATPFAGQQQRDRPEQQRRAHHAVDAQREGLTPPGLASDQSTLLPIGALSPQTMLATHRAACPFSFPLSIFRSPFEKRGSEAGAGADPFPNLDFGRRP